MLWACVGAEGFVPLCSSSPSCSPPVLLSPAHPSSEPPGAAWGKVPGASWPLLPPGAGSWQLRCLSCHSSQALFWAACSFACWCGATLPGAALCLTRMTRSSRNGCPSACLGAAVPWLPSTSWASSTWPTLVTAGMAPAFHLVIGEHPCRAESSARGVASEENLVPSLKLDHLGEGSSTGQSHPCLPTRLGDSVPCRDRCVSLVCTWSCRIASQNLRLASSPATCFPDGSGSHLAPAASPGLGWELGSENCLQQSFQECARSHFRADFIPVNCFRRRTHKSMCRQVPRGAWNPRILSNTCISLGAFLSVPPGSGREASPPSAEGEAGLISCIYCRVSLSPAVSGQQTQVLGNRLRLRDLLPMLGWRKMRSLEPSLLCVGPLLGGSCVGCSVHGVPRL